ncbi:MAG: NAD-dependent DNA ligase LigA [Planctomycetota bacterium]
MQPGSSHEHAPSKPSAREFAEEAAGLRSEIARADDQYYNRGQSDISDSEYDALFVRLRALETAHPDLITADSPTQRVGAPLPTGTDIATHEHRVPMLSIESLTSEDAVREFDKRTRRFLGLDDGAALRWAVEPKFDGVSANLLYEDGTLTLALSRGDGARGEDITRNVRTIRNVPLRLPGHDGRPQRCEVRGEVIFSRPTFERLREEAETTTETPFRNPRNAAAGTLKQLDPAIVRRRGLEFIAWGVGAWEGEPVPATYAAVREQLRAWGFEVATDFVVARDIDGVLAFHHELEVRRDVIDYEMDGVVAKVDEVELQQRLGRTARAPRWLLAYKFAPRRATTTVVSITAQVGRTGAVTPVANLEPIELAGVTVKRATLHNWALLAERDIRAGDTVEVERAGDVIPEVMRVLARPPDSHPAHIPAHCPSCSGPLETEGKFVYCQNVECPDQLRGHIVHMCGRRALDIEGLGPEKIDQLVEAGLLSHPEDVFTLEQHEAEITALEGWGKRSFDKLCAQIARAKRPALARYLNALGIRHVGEQTAKDLAAHFGTLEAVTAASEEDFDEVKGVGTEVARALHAFFANDGNKRFLHAAHRAGVEVLAQPKQEVAATGPLAGSVFCFTGGLGTLSREQAKELVEARGARVVDSITKVVTHVVAGSRAGSKLQKAEKLGLTILDEAAFVALVEASAE